MFGRGTCKSHLCYVREREREKKKKKRERESLTETENERPETTGRYGSMIQHEKSITATGSRLPVSFRLHPLLPLYLITNARFVTGSARLAPSGGQRRACRLSRIGFATSMYHYRVQRLTRKLLRVLAFTMHMQMQLPRSHTYGTRYLI